MVGGTTVLVVLVVLVAVVLVEQTLERLETELLTQVAEAVRRVWMQAVLQEARVLVVLASWLSATQALKGAQVEQ